MAEDGLVGVVEVVDDEVGYFGAGLGEGKLESMGALDNLSDVIVYYINVSTKTPPAAGES